jgi:hypothetical protein
VQASRLQPRLLLSVAALLGSACSDATVVTAPEPAYQALVTSRDWSRVARADDVFITDPDAVPTCVGDGFFIENSWVELDTSLCSWVTLQASARFVVEDEQSLRLVVSHFDLVALEPAQAELRLRLGDCEVWSRRVDIPQPAALYSEPLLSPCRLDAGGIIQFHLHNHGQNSWQLRELAILR